MPTLPSLLNSPNDHFLYPAPATAPLPNFFPNQAFPGPSQYQHPSLSQLHNQYPAPNSWPEQQSEIPSTELTLSPTYLDTPFSAVPRLRHLPASYGPYASQSVPYIGLHQPTESNADLYFRPHLPATHSFPGYMEPRQVAYEQSNRHVGPSPWYGHIEHDPTHGQEMPDIASSDHPADRSRNAQQY